MRYLIIALFAFIIFGCSIQPKESGIKIYGVREGFENPFKDCYNCFDENSVKLSENPILDESDIQNFNWKNQQIFLNKSGREKLKKIDIKLSGLPVVMVLNNKRIYGFWFWDIYSSFGCDRVYTVPKMDFKIEFGLPTDHTFGQDPRFNKLLEKYVKDKYTQY